MYNSNSHVLTEYYHADSTVTDFFHCHLIYDLCAMAPTQDEMLPNNAFNKAVLEPTLARATFSQCMVGSASLQR